MRKKSEIANHRRQVPSGLGRRASLPPRAYAGEFLLAHLVAFHYAILHPIPGGDGFHDFRSFATRTASPRKAVHTFHCRRREIVHIACRARRAQASMREKVWGSENFLDTSDGFLETRAALPHSQNESVGASFCRGRPVGCLGKTKLFAFQPTALNLGEFGCSRLAVSRHLRRWLVQDPASSIQPCFCQRHKLTKGRNT